MSDDFFQHKAAVYEQDERRVANVHTIAGSIIKRIALKPTMQLMDFGSGTGLLLGQIASHVAKITAVDISKSMNQQLRDKKDSLACEVEVLEMDLCTTDLDRKFDGIISSMTMHHVEDVPAMFEKFRSLLKPGGFIAIADLETEDGSFHTEDTGVFHNGFDGQALVDFATDAGFKQAEVAQASIVHKLQGEYPVLLLTATID